MLDLLALAASAPILCFFMDGGGPAAHVRLNQTVPQYREASPSQKRTLLDAFVAATGYHRTYARWLLNHAGGVQQTLRRPRPAQYGPDV